MLGGLIMSAILLTACATDPSSPDVRSVCPAVKVYSQEQMSRGAAEMLAYCTKPDLMMCMFITDYAQERAKLRACRGE